MLMMKSIKPIALVLLLVCGISTCSTKEKIYDRPFVYIKDLAGVSVSSVDCTGTSVIPYRLYISTKNPGKDISVDFTIASGDGLQQDVDYRVLTASPLTFPNGTFQRDIRIEWLVHDIDPAKDNTLTITLAGCSENFTLGMPGPDHLFVKHVITKVKLYN